MYVSLNMHLDMQATRYMHLFASVRVHICMDCVLCSVYIYRHVDVYKYVYVYVYTYVSMCVYKCVSACLCARVRV